MALTLEVKSGSFGTAVLTNGTATSATLVDLTGVSQTGDVAILFFNGLNAGTNSSTALSLWKDSGGTERLAIMNNVSENIIGNHARHTQVAMVRVDNPAASLWYSWSVTPTSFGADIWVQMNIRGFELA